VSEPAAPPPVIASGLRPPARLYAGLILLVFLLTVGLSLYVYPRLPEQIPMQFGAGGLPSHRIAKSRIGWLTLPLCGLGTAALLLLLGHGTVRLGRRWPRLLNVPLKEEFLKLPPERREPVYQELAELCWALGGFVSLFFAGLQALTYQAALAPEQRLAMTPFWMLLGTFVAGVLYFSLVPLLRIRHYIRAAAAARKQGSRGKS